MVSGILIIGGVRKKSDGSKVEFDSKLREVWRQNNYLHKIKVITYKDVIDSLKFKKNSFQLNSL